MGEAVKLLFMLLIVFGIFQGISPNVDDLSQAAETAYIEGDFQEAAKLYQQMIDEGVQTGEVYFNLGNAYYQLHDLGSSLVNYLRAAQLMPRDEDLRLNIARVRAQRVDASIASVAFSDQITEWESSWLSKAEVDSFLLVLWWLSCGCLSAYALLPHWRKWVRWAAIICCAILIFVGFANGIRVIVESLSPSAVIVGENVPVLTGSDSKYMQIFELHAAGEVHILERRNDWVRVQLPDLQEGWVQADSVEII